ncbi:hypothetical protein HNV11_01930 [Spirosoma taeanense]|uniref:DUF5683 domain-containing protein n=1 Tax=Spirosoma taeanense TaxID=2735870 RepID=A0A6M5Y484_9BACT|nr:hypothetical protein [Spirosoma taeanense]QJW88224.1 hypothetical protein HNV11_01930 [Spirosoma taeanense]
MKRLLLLTLPLIVVSLTTVAQRSRRADDTGHYRTVPIPAHLMPIERAYSSSALGSIYFYGGKKLSSPYSLEVPFYELDDPTVNHHFKAYRTMTTLSRLTAFVPLAYILLRNSRSNSAYWTVYGGSIAASLAFVIIGNGQVNKAVSRYNEMLQQPRVGVGVSVAPVPLTGHAAVGVGAAWRF